MKEKVYPIIIKKGEEEGKTYYFVSVPDFEIDTFGKSLAAAIESARDAIELTGITWQDMKKKLPEATELSKVEKEQDEIVTLVDVDFDAYRRKYEKRAVRKNCSIPSWLNEKAEAEGVNFSEILQRALIAELGL